MIKNKKILFFIPDMSSGGSQRVASYLIRHWCDMGYSVVLATYDKKEDFYSIPPIVVREYIDYRAGMRWSNNYYIIRSIRRIYDSHSPDVIVSFLATMNTRLLLSFFTKKPAAIVISERNDPSRQRIGYFWEAMRVLLYRRANLVTANSTVAITVMKKYVPAKKLILVRNPVVLPSEISLLSEPTILCVGRLVQQKRHELVIQAISDYSLRNWSLVILGEGSERRNLELMAERYLQAHRLKLPGVVSNPEKFYKTSSIFIMASDYEGVPNALLEAMSFGLPCIVSDSLPGALEYIEDGVNGLVFKSGDVKDLIDKLAILTNDVSFRKQLGHSARATIHDLSFPKVMAVWDETIASL